MPRVWFITGCSSGLGRELAITAAKHQDRVVATSRDPSKLSGLVELGIIAKRLDLRANVEEIRAVVDEVASTVGPIDILVNNAGYILEGAVEECRCVHFFPQRQGHRITTAQRPRNQGRVRHKRLLSDKSFARRPAVYACTTIWGRGQPGVHRGMERAPSSWYVLRQ